MLLIYINFWFDSSVGVEIDKKRRAFKALKLAGTAETLVPYKEANKSCKKATTQAKINMIKGIAASSNINPKLCFKYVYSEKMKQEGVRPLLTEGRSIG